MLNVLLFKTKIALRLAGIVLGGKPPYYPLPEIMRRFVDEPRRDAFSRLLSDNRQLFQSVQGSTNNHQAWPGGYYDHIEDGLNVVILLYLILNACRPLPFSLASAVVAFFCHDLEKPWKYELRDGQLHHRSGVDTKEECQRFRLAKLAEYGITLTPEEENAVRYAEGELADYSGRRRTMNQLAALVHMADNWSARGWFDHPLAQNDPWSGRGRSRM